MPELPPLTSAPVSAPEAMEKAGGELCALNCARCATVRSVPQNIVLFITSYRTCTCRHPVM